jgi:hypothetical protein
MQKLATAVSSNHWLGASRSQRLYGNTVSSEVGDPMTFCFRRNFTPMMQTKMQKEYQLWLLIAILEFDQK